MFKFDVVVVVDWAKLERELRAEFGDRVVVRDGVVVLDSWDPVEEALAKELVAAHQPVGKRKPVADDGEEA